jgi:hypothetical protein
MTPEDVEALKRLRYSLLRRQLASLGYDQGAEAFEEHQILAIKIHRAAKLAQSARDREGEAWMRYFRDFFPSGRNGEAEANLLWIEWRTSLLKNDAPGPSIAITHGQSHIHWTRDRSGVLAINLEDMWADYQASVDAFTTLLESDDERRGVVLARWRETLWSVRSFVPERAFMLGSVSAVASAASVTGWGGPDRH